MGVRSGGVQRLDLVRMATGHWYFRDNPDPRDRLAFFVGWAAAVG
jgi:hypothetical protein